jgi:NADP-reducing hydrogenase subunit HndC
VLTTIRYFRDEYEAHIKEKKCPAGVCKELITFYIIPDNCTGCGLCARYCSENAISGVLKQPYVIDEKKCISCGVCRNVCKFDAVTII